MLAVQFGTLPWSIFSAQPLLMILAAIQSVRMIMSQPVARPPTSAGLIVSTKALLSPIFSS